MSFFFSRSTHGNDGSVHLCVGTLLVSSYDLQELAELTTQEAWTRSQAKLCKRDTLPADGQRRRTFKMSSHDSSTSSSSWLGSMMMGFTKDDDNLSLDRLKKRATEMMHHLNNEEGRLKLKRRATEVSQLNMVEKGEMGAKSWVAGAMTGRMRSSSPSDPSSSK